MIRYTHDLGDESYVAVALEDPDSDVIPPPEPGESENIAPDLTGRLRWKNDLGHVQASLFAGAARYEPDSGGADTVFLWGTNLSTKTRVFEKDAVFVQATYGPGVGRYRGGSTAGPDSDGDLEAITVLAGMLGYEHHWSDEFRSTVVYSLGEGDLPSGVPPDTNEVLEYFAANFIWQFCERAWCGVEYLYGARETDDDARGRANRVQFSIRFDF
jgi:hypothetical protein